jgi:hypothetical protein
VGVLGKVTTDLEGPRGPDVEMSVEVPARFLGRTVEVSLPRNLNCAACGGGGCDQCDRAGALSLRERDQPPATLEVVLPKEAKGQALRIRIPEQGGAPRGEGEGRGHLILTVVVGAEAGSRVRLTVQARQEERRELMKRSVYMAVFLVLLFVGLLRLSGWL